MNKLILNTDIQHFIEANSNTDVNAILLKGTNFKGVSTQDIVEQIVAKTRCKRKLPTWFSTSNIYYPNKLNIEQTSSEITAKYKTELIEGNTLIDITGGFGVDCYYFSKRFKSVIHCEINQQLSSIVAHNYAILNADNIKTKSNDGLDYLKTSNQYFDWIYLDPSRRNDVKGKVFFLEDCLPNVPKCKAQLFEHSKNILIKTSPMLDVSAGIKALQNVKNIHVVGVNNEVKELLWVLQKDYNGEILMHTANLKAASYQNFSFTLNRNNSLAPLSLPLSYLYEPNTSILKSGGFNEISKQLEVFKLHEHSHLYTSTSPINFPGRIFKIKQVIPYNKKRLKQLGIIKANITIRNFPEPVAQLRKKLNIKEGGDLYLFFTTNMQNDRIVILCSKQINT